MFHKHRRLAALILLPIGFLASAFAILEDISEAGHSSPLSAASSISKKMISDAISGKITQNIFPEHISLSAEEDQETEYKVNYTLQSELQEHAETLLKRYKPDYGAIVMMDAKTGEILAMSSFEKDSNNDDNLALKAGYPAASVFKVITAAAAVDKAGVSPEHRIAFNGGNYTLYKKNVLSDRVNRWTRFITLKEAFAQSINTAFGRLSLESLEPSDLFEYANKFYFNHKIPSDFPVETSSVYVPEEKGFALTQVASGYNRYNTLSPVHGAMIASAIINEGKMLSPYLVKSIENNRNETIYAASPESQGQVISAESAAKVKQMMEQTVLSGTSRKTFRSIVRERQFREIEMGGKTGHFTGMNPRGRTDWFVGYASDEDSRIAIAAITVNVKYWTVKSSALGEMMFRKYFKDKIEDEKILSDIDSEEKENSSPAKATARNHRS